MERDPSMPPSHVARARVPATPPQPERGSFFEKWRKKAKQPEESSSPERPKKKRENAETQNAPEVPKPERRTFGKNILGLLRPKAEVAEAPKEQPAMPEAQPVLLTPEDSPQYERATRMRRFARIVIARVIGEAASEPARSRRRREAEPLSTTPLLEAAGDLREAADDLTYTTHAAREVSAETPQNVESHSDNYGSYESAARPERAAPIIDQTASERLDDRLRQLELSAEVSKTASIAATGLGVIAVILTGAEYFSRKHGERIIKRDTAKEFKKQELALEQQRVMFDRLRESQVKEMNRNERREYYERLSVFTHQQAERTREATRELQEVVVQSAPEGYVIERPHREEPARERRERRPIQRETAQNTQEQELAPLLRVENADTIERAPGRQTGSAGTGFFGGGGGGIASGTGPSDFNAPAAKLDPNSREARQLEALRKAEQARLQQNAWLYSAALIVTIIVLVIVTIVVG